MVLGSLGGIPQLWSSLSLGQSLFRIGIAFIYFGNPLKCNFSSSSCFVEKLKQLRPQFRNFMTAANINMLRM